MYEIIMHCWYQETKNEVDVEVYYNLGFKTLEEGCKYLGDNVEKIINEYPVMWFSVEYNKSKIL